jgi:hypothetical protein
VLAHQNEGEHVEDGAGICCEIPKMVLTGTAVAAILGEDDVMNHPSFLHKMDVPLKKQAGY